MSKSIEILKRKLNASDPEPCDGRVIDEFNGDNHFLSNFFPYEFVFHGRKHMTVEHLYQSMKTMDPAEKSKIFSATSPAEAKRIGRSVKIRPDWNDVRYAVMLSAVRAKFTQSLSLTIQLLNTGRAHLIEGNWWCDNLWGDCRCEKCRGIEGKNQLGMILMQVRKELREIFQEG